MRIVRVLTLIAAVCLLIGCGSQKREYESGPDFVMHRALADMKEQGYELRDLHPAIDGIESFGIQVWRSKNFEIRMAGSESSLTVSRDGELRTFQGEYIVSFEYRPQGSNDRWVRAQRYYEVGFEDGEWWARPGQIRETP
jgi:hypothetical protein